MSPTVAPLDSTGREQMVLLSTILQANPTCETSASSEAWWLGLAYLNRHRTSPEVQTSLLRWADALATHLKTCQGASDQALFHEGNNLYRQGKFGAASQCYTEALTKCPKHYDARNNLALAQLHKGNDLIAQLEWEILCRLSKTYVPARINLTVVYERLGRRDRAQVMAQDALAICPEVPSAVFNAAWLRDVQGQRDAAIQLLQPFAELEVNPKLVRFHSQLTGKSPN